MPHPILADTELTVLEERYALQPESLEAKLIRSYLALNVCWKCTAELHPEEHPHCLDCPEWNEGEDPD